MNWKDSFPHNRRFFETNNGILYNDKMENIISNIKDNSICTVITDPPYGVRKEKWDNLENYKSNLNNWINELLRISKYGILWFTVGKYLPLVVNANLKYYHRILVWNKPPGSQFNGASHSNIWYSIEFIIVFMKEIPKVNCSYHYACIDNRTILFKEYNHPTTKPLNLMAILINHYSNENDIILDPFAGTGTTLVAAEILNRKWIGIEMDIKYCQTAKERILNEGINLFTK